MFQPFDLPPGIILLITDTIAAPADFVLHRTLIAHLKEQTTPRSLVLSVSEGIARWSAIASKSNVNLKHHLNLGTLEFLDVLSPSSAKDLNFEDGDRLTDAISHVQKYLNREQGKSTLIILDDIATLDWIGIPTFDVVRFIRALRAACLKANATLLVRHHIVTRGEPDDLFRHLLQICNYHLEVAPLSSGKSVSVSGELSLHPGFSVPLKPVKLVPRSMATQYRLADSGPVYFAKGTSGTVL